VRRFPSNDGFKDGYPSPQRKRYFAAINSSSVKTVADRHRLLLIITSTADELSGFPEVPTSMTLNDLEP